MRLVGRDGKDIPHRMDLKRSSHDENEVCLIAVFSDARVEAIRQILSKEDNVGLNESTTATAHRNATFIHSFLGNGGGIGFVTANAGAGRTRAMPSTRTGRVSRRSDRVRQCSGCRRVGEVPSSGEERGRSERAWGGTGRWYKTSPLRGPKGNRKIGRSHGN